MEKARALWALLFMFVALTGVCRAGITYYAGTGHYYEAVAGDWSDWNTAKAKAEALSYLGYQGHLATITGGGENEFIRSLLVVDPSHSYWLGGYQDPPTSPAGSNWLWVTGEPWGYTNWAPGEPNDDNAITGHEDCLMMHSPSDPDWGKWNDLHHGNINGYVIEYVPEPATLSLLALGGPVVVRRRRRF